MSSSRVAVQEEDRYPSFSFVEVPAASECEEEECEENLWEKSREVETNNNIPPILKENQLEDFTAGDHVLELFEGPIGYNGADEESTTDIVTYGCGICFTIAGFSIQAFRRHQKEFHKGLHRCKVCKKRYTSKRYLENHMMSHIVYPCQHCSAEFQYFIEVEEHQKVHISKKSFKCDKCGQDFYLQASLNQHCSHQGGCLGAQENVRRVLQKIKMKNKKRKNVI